MPEHPSTTVVLADAPVVPADARGVPEVSVHSAASSDFDRRHEALLGDILAARERRSLMEDLACYVDSSLVRAGSGEIVARRGGVKAWLQTNIPALYLKYKTVMAYKAAAWKLKQMTGLRDPVPAAQLVETPAAGDAVEVVRAREVYAEVMRETPRNRTAYLDRIDALVNPARVGEAEAGRRPSAVLRH